jgi:hypothetical protein
MRPWGLEGGHVVFQSEIKQNYRRNIYKDKKEKSNLLLV